MTWAHHQDSKGIHYPPCAYRLAFPVLYCVTLCIWCFLHALLAQKAFLVFGTFTCSNHTDWSMYLLSMSTHRLLRVHK